MRKTFTRNEKRVEIAKKDPVKRRTLRRSWFKSCPPSKWLSIPTTSLCKHP